MSASATITVIRHDGSRIRLVCGHGSPFELGIRLASAPFWQVTDHGIQAPEEQEALDYLQDNLGARVDDGSVPRYSYTIDFASYSASEFASLEGEDEGVYPLTALSCFGEYSANRQVASALRDLLRKKEPESISPAAQAARAAETDVCSAGTSAERCPEPDRKLARSVEEPTGAAMSPKTPKHSTQVKWASRYFEIAKLVSTWSKDPSTKVGAIIVGDKGQIISQGYNGFPRGVEDLQERYDHRETKYKFVVHAEMNAILNALYNGSSVVGASIYIHNLPVCQECAKAIIQSGISRVYIDTEIEGKWLDAWQFSKTMFRESGVEIYKFDPAACALKKVLD